MKSLFIAAISTIAVSASAADLGVANSFNGFVFGDFIGTTADTEGRLAVGGNFQAGPYGYSVNNNSVSAGYGLITGGSVTANSASVKGGIFSNGNLTYTNPSVISSSFTAGNVVSNGNINFGNSGGQVTGTISLPSGKSYSAPSYFSSPIYTSGPTASPVNFAQAQSQLTSLSTYLGNYTANGTYTNAYNNLVLTGTSSTLNVFTITAADFQNSVDLKVNAPSTSTVVINILGSNLVVPGHAYNWGSVSKTNVLMNFPTATSVKWTYAGIEAAMLMPNADLTSTYSYSAGNIRGTLVAKNFYGTMELESNNVFTGNLPTQPVPEPASLIALGTGAIALIKKRRAK